jgi:alpha-L-rhamnosidase
VKALRLKTERVAEPAALTERSPLFSFEAEGGGAGTAYKIAVAPDAAALSRGERVWESGVYDYRETAYARYGGKPLAPDTEYVWAVTDAEGKLISEPARFGIGLFRGDWRARWVTRERESGVAPIFLRNFALAGGGKEIAGAKLYVTGLGYFKAYCNGESVSEDEFVPQVSDYGARPLDGLFETAPIGTKKTAYYRCYDIKNLLRLGDNALAVWVGNGWYNNREKPNEGNFCYGGPKALFELRIRFSDGSAQTVCSGEDTRAADSNLLKNTLYTGEVVDFNVRNRFDLREYGDGETAPARVLPDAEGELLYQKEAPDVAGERFAPAAVLRDGDTALYDFGQNHSGVLRVKVRGAKNARVKFVYAENKTADNRADVWSSSWGGHVQADELILSGGADEYRSVFTVHGYRYCEAALPDGAEILEIESLFVHSGAAGDGAFECGELLFNRINRNYRYTCLSNFHGNVPTDCPHRERRGFLGDGHAHFSAAMYNFDMRGGFCKWLKDMRDAQSETGYMPHTAPFAAGGGGPGFGSACLIAPLKYYRFYGDVSPLAEGFCGMLNWVKYLNTRHDGDYIVVREEKGWCIGEWFNPTLIDLDIPFANTYFFALCVKLATEVAGILGEYERKSAAGADGARDGRPPVAEVSPERELPWLSALYRRITDAFLKRYYDYGTHLFCGGGKGAAFFGLDLGVLDEAEARECLETELARIAERDYRIETGIFGTPLMLKILSDAGRDDVLYRILSRKGYPGYAYMIERGATTLWEGFEERVGPDYLLRGGTPQTGYGVSHSHPMLGSVCAWFYASIAGLGLDRIGSDRVVTVAPWIGGEIERARAEKHTVYGPARVAWERKGHTAKISFAVPFSCRGEIRLKSGFRDWVLDGVPVRPETRGAFDTAAAGSGGHTLTVGL